MQIGLPANLILDRKGSRWAPQQLDFEHVAFRCQRCFEHGHDEAACPAKRRCKPQNVSGKRIKKWADFGRVKTPVENDLPEDTIDLDMVKNEPPEEPADSNVPVRIDQKI